MPARGRWPHLRLHPDIADHPGEIPNDKDRLVTEVLELPQFSQNDRMAEVNVGRGWVDAQLYSQRPAERELVTQFILTDDLCRPLF